MTTPSSAFLLAGAPQLIGRSPKDESNSNEERKQPQNKPTYPLQIQPLGRIGDLMSQAIRFIRLQVTVQCPTNANVSN